MKRCTICEGLLFGPAAGLERGDLVLCSVCAGQVLSVVWEQVPGAVRRRAVEKLCRVNHPVGEKIILKES